MFLGGHANSDSCQNMNEIHVILGSRLSHVWENWGEIGYITGKLVILLGENQHEQYMDQYKRFRGLSHMLKYVYFNTHAGVSREARGVHFGFNLHLKPYFAHASSEGSGESAHIRRTRLRLRCLLWAELA